MPKIPTKVNKYNVYNDAEKLIGNGDELTLPSFEAQSETISGAGILGEIDDPTIGYFSNQTIEIPFRVFDKEAVAMLNMTTATKLTIRGAVQVTDSDGSISFQPFRMVVSGRCSQFNPGKMKAGGAMEASVTLTLLYVYIEIDGDPAIELGKLTDTYKVNGVDVMSEINAMC
jgi:hypothetical protein